MRRHDLDAVSLVSGLVFAAVGIAFLTGRVDVMRLDPTWLAPVAAIVLGLVLIARLVRRGRGQGLE